MHRKSPGDLSHSGCHLSSTTSQASISAIACLTPPFGWRSAVFLIEDELSLAQRRGAGLRERSDHEGAAATSRRPRGRGRALWPPSLARPGSARPQWQPRRPGWGRRWAAALPRPRTPRNSRQVSSVWVSVFPASLSSAVPAGPRLGEGRRRAGEVRRVSGAPLGTSNPTRPRPALFPALQASVALFRRRPMSPSGKGSREVPGLGVPAAKPFAVSVEEIRSGRFAG
jgi:hypothetical protein